jgi:hypothetical protein
VEQRWIEEGYPEIGRVNAIADEVVAHTLSDTD